MRVQAIGGFAQRKLVTLLYMILPRCTEDWQTMPLNREWLYTSACSALEHCHLDRPMQLTLLCWHLHADSEIFLRELSMTHGMNCDMLPWLPPQEKKKKK